MLKRLLGEQRLRVPPDDARVFRAEGEFAWTLSVEAWPAEVERRGSVVAGTRYARNAASLATLPRIVIPIAA